MYYAANATWVLHDPQQGISIRKDAFEPGAIIQVEPGQLERSLDQLEQLAKTQGKRPKLEIHCHGDPAKLHLGSPGRINVATVQWFGNRLARCLRAGGQIELLACEVASQGKFALRELQECEPRNIVGYRPAYHDALRLRKSRRYRQTDVDAIMIPVYGGSHTLRPTMTAAERAHYRTLLDDPGKRGEAITFAYKFATEDVPNKKFIPKPEYDGLEFCLSLASSSGCAVRAAVTSQIEDESQSSWSQTPIGNWEYEVFDFFPSGEIKFLGASPYRGPLMNSVDLDRFGAV